MDKTKLHAYLEMLRGLKRLTLFFRRSGTLAPGFIVAATIVQGLMPVLELWALSRLVDELAGLIAGRTGALDHPATVAGLNSIWFWVLLIVAMRLAGRGLSHAESYAGNLIMENMTFLIQSDVLSKASRLSLKDYELPEFYNKLANAKNGMGLGFSNLFLMTFRFIQMMITAGGLVVITAQGHWIIPVLILAAGLPILKLTNKQNVQRYYMITGNTPRNRMMSYIVGQLTGRNASKEIRLFGLGPYLTSRWKTLFEEVRQEALMLGTKQRLHAAFLQLLPIVTYGICLAVLIWSIRANGLSIGTVVAVISAVLSLQNNWEACIRNWGQIHNTYMRFVKDLLTFLDLAEPEAGRDKNVYAISGIEADGVSFSYPGAAKPVLRDISFRLKPGEKVALIGENGAGKSTLVKLLLGLYEPVEGTIRYGGRDLKSMDPSAVWEQVSAVFQDFAKYNLTARETIGFGQVDKMEDMVLLRRASGQGGAAEFVERWEHGYETYLGPTFGGRDLSGGQWQKIASSRGFMREPSFLVLDEPTAALDPQAEVEVYRRFQEMAGNRTALLISHRIGFALLADRILVMKDGELIESGTHEELTQLNGEYAKLLDIQSQWYR